MSSGWRKKDTLCWSCVYANDICPFHRQERRLVKGSKYIETTRIYTFTSNGITKNRREKSYIITECPKYKKVERKKRNA